MSHYNPNAFVPHSNIAPLVSHHVPTTSHHFDLHSFQTKYTPYVPYKSTYVIPESVHVEVEAPKVEAIEEVAEVKHVEEVKPVEVAHTTALYTHY